MGAATGEPDDRIRRVGRGRVEGVLDARRPHGLQLRPVDADHDVARRQPTGARRHVLAVAEVELALVQVDVGVTHAGGHRANQHLGADRRRRLDLDLDQRRARLGRLDAAHQAGSLTIR